MKRDKASDIEAFLKKPDSAIRLALIHGSDEGLVRERAALLAKSVVPDLRDPFRVTSLTGEQLAQDPARLADEAAAIPMGGGRKVVRITDAPKGLTSQRQSQILRDFVSAPMGDALVIVEAGELRKDNAFLKAAEAAKNAVAIRCYPDEDWALEKVIADTLAQHGLVADDAATAYLVDHLGGDRLLTRRELEKLALFAGTRGKNQPITLEEAAASVGDTAGLTYDDLCFAIAGGDRVMADRCVTRLQAEGEAPVAILRIVSKHFQRLHAFHAAVGAGRSPEEAARSARVFGPRANTFMAAARYWQGGALTEAFRRLNEAESRCKSTGFPDWIVAARTLAALASMPQRGARRP
ncbi:MAG TPA: DNA polymerase III subunit delta [Alphaproteobacteria bacterium]|jgi:DNA polymerase-3 subunit delta